MPRCLSQGARPLKKAPVNNTERMNVFLRWHYPDQVEGFKRQSALSQPSILSSPYSVHKHYNHMGRFCQFVLWWKTGVFRPPCGPKQSLLSVRVAVRNHLSITGPVYRRLSRLPCREARFRCPCRRACVLRAPHWPSVQTGCRRCPRRGALSEAP